MDQKMQFFSQRGEMEESFKKQKDDLEAVAAEEMKKGEKLT